MNTKALWKRVQREVGNASAPLRARWQSIWEQNQESSEPRIF